ncbi:MAG: DUF547 domain-containing protein [Alphaproteobacteria bacterium]|nr:DUF547 domain-containing protein [Alphaproteobacteria bacterium]
MNLKVIKRWAPLIILAVLMATAFANGLHEKISLQVLQENKGAMLDAVASRPVLTALGFMALYIVFVALSLPAATLLTLTGGFLFGSWLGTFYVVTAATIGATIIFFIAKTSLGTTLREKAGGLYKRVEDNMKDNATGYLLFMRLVPVFPFFLVNIVPALFNVKPRTFILTTFFGIIPGSFVYVNLGGQLADIDKLGDLVSMQTLLAFVLLGVFALIPTLYKQIKGKKKIATALFAAALLSAPHAYADDYKTFLSLYDGLLQEYVSATEKDGVAYNGVDYDGWASDPRHKQTLKLLLAQNTGAFKGDKKMAFWINAYNFLTIELIVREGERNTIKNLGGTFTSPWKNHSWTLSGTDITLDYIEHKILRPMGDARIHFAINCASVSCPDLRLESYRSETLNQQLNEQTMITLANEGKGLRIENGTIAVSKIFDWFKEDFKGGDVKGWLGDYKDIDQNASIEFMDYDWSLNKVN